MDLENARFYARQCHDTIEKNKGFYVYQKNIFKSNILNHSDFELVYTMSDKKIFVSYENGCIFASAFAQKTGVEKKKRQLFETDEKKEIACVGIHI